MHIEYKLRNIMAIENSVASYQSDCNDNLTNLIVKANQKCVKSKSTN